MLLVTRHGQTLWNVEKKVQGKADIELNDTGREQAKEVSNKLKCQKIDLIISSPLKRAKETAEIIAKEINVPVIFDEGISERDFGEFEGKGKKDFDFKTFWNFESSFKYEKAENICDFFDRIYKAIDRIKEQYKDKNILIVTHGGVSMPIACYFNGMPDDGNLLALALHNCEVATYNMD